MTLKVYGVERLGAVVAHTCELARALAGRVDAEPALERLAPVALNIVCFRFIDATDDLDRLNADIVADLQESGIAAPSLTTVAGKRAIRAAIFNHRTRLEDVEALVAAVLAIGRSRSLRAVRAPSEPPPCRHVGKSS